MIRLELVALKKELSLMSNEIRGISVEIPGLRGRLLREQYDSARRIILDFERKVLDYNALSMQEFPVAKNYLDICDGLRKKVEAGYQEATG